MWPAMTARRSRPEVRAGDDRVAVADDLEMVEAAERRLDVVGEPLLVARHRLDVAELAGEVDGRSAEVERHPTNLEPCPPTFPPNPPRPTAHAWGYGLATVAGDGTVLDTWFPEPKLGGLPAGRDRWIAPAELEELAGDDARRNVRIDIVTVEIDLDAAPGVDAGRLPAPARALAPARPAEHHQPRRDLRAPADRGLDQRRPGAPGRLRPAAADAAARGHPRDRHRQVPAPARLRHPAIACASPTPRACASARTSRRAPP